MSNDPFSNSEVQEIADEINHLSNILPILELAQKYNSIPLDASPYVNFRDALSHYRKLIDSYCKNETHKVIRQSASIREHIFRGTKDALYYISNISLFKT